MPESGAGRPSLVSPVAVKATKIAVGSSGRGCRSPASTWDQSRCSHLCGSGSSFPNFTVSVRASVHVTRLAAASNRTRPQAMAGREPRPRRIRVWISGVSISRSGRLTEASMSSQSRASLALAARIRPSWISAFLRMFSRVRPG